MWVPIDVARTGLVQIALHPLRSVATVAAVTVVLIPYVTGIGISMGVQRAAEQAVQYGADLYVSGTQFGQPAPVPLDAVARIEAIEGVVSVTPRITGPIVLGRERLPAVVVGLPIDRLPQQVDCIQGRLFKEGAPELILGSRLAKRLHLQTGDRMPPFYRGSQGERVSQVVGVFRADGTLWEMNLLFTSLSTAGEIFDQKGVVTEFLVYCRPGYANAVREQLTKAVTFTSNDQQRPLRPYITTRQDLQAQLPVGLLHREGIFNLHFLLAFVVAILVVLVTSGFGLSERQREIAILKATGWMTDELLLRSSTESLLLSLLSASLAVIVSYVWLRWCHGYWIAGAFLFGTGSDFDTVVPFVLTPWPVLLSFLISFVIIMSGTVYSTWRAATAAPWTVLRR